VVLGFDSIHGYLNAQEKYHGTSVGRFCNRIANGRFTLDGQQYILEQNNGDNSLHGGSGGFHSRVWDRRVSFNKKVDFYYVSSDGEEGFPGELKTTVSYELTNENEIIIQFRAETNKTTIVNLTNHAYFNLNGEGNGDILNHVLHIPAVEFLPVTEKHIPSGDILPVQGTALDFTLPKKIAEGIVNEDDHLKYTKGFDHTFVNTQPLNQPAASAYSEQSGVRLDVFTSEPGVHLYTGNFLADDEGKIGQRYLKHGGFCFETQHYPDSPNKSHFPSVVLHPGEVFESQTIYRFAMQK